MSAAALNLELAGSAAVYPQKIEDESALLIRMSEADYRRASFLDDRILTHRTEGHWFPYADIRSRAAGAVAAGPAHFIFHSGHVGSTLLSRLLDEAPEVLNLREPLPLRSLAELHDRASASEDAVQFQDQLQTFLRLWRRGFVGTRRIVVKATSATGRIAPLVLEASPESQAVYLNVRLETYLATLLAGANALSDLEGFAPERARRLTRFLGPDQAARVPPSSGELAASAWLTERLTQQRAKQALGGRLLEIDFDALLAAPEPALAEIARHFGIVNAGDFARAAARSSLWTRYSKVPEQYEYSPSMRAELLRGAMREHAEELRAGLSLIEHLAARHAEVNALLRK